MFQFENRRRFGTAPAHSPEVWLRPRQQPLPLPLGGAACSLCSSAEHALRRGIRAVGLGHGDEVLVPLHHDPALVEALLSCGLSVKFYSEAGEIDPEEADLERLTSPRTRALMLVHQLGFPQDIPRWRSFCDARGWMLLEDATQAWPASSGTGAVGAAGDVAVFSFAETLGLPGVAALVCPQTGTAAEQRRGLSRAVQLHAQWLARRLAPLSDGGAAAAEMDRFVGIVREPAAGAPPAVAVALLARLADPEIAAVRRANYRALLDGLGDQVLEPFASVPGNAAPAIFPVQLRDRARARQRLIEAGIGTRHVWRVPHPSLDDQRSIELLHQRGSSIGLPVHQALRPGDLERIVDAMGGRRRRFDLRVEPLPSLSAARAECELLEERAGNIFTTFEWMSAWWTHQRDDHSLLLAACRDASGEAVAVLPLVSRRERGLRVVRLLGHGPADRLAPVCAPADRPRVARALRRVLHGSNCDVFIGEQMPADECWGAALGAVVLEREATPVLQIDGMSWDDFLSARSPNFRQQVRRRERRLAREHELRYRLADDPTRLAADMETLMELHHSRWQAEGSAAFAGPRRDLHQQFARRALEHGWLRLWLLELDEQPVAAWYGFRYGGAEWFYQSGRDVSAGGANVGFVLLCHTIREAMNDGVHEYRMLRGDEAYKGRFASRDPGLQTVALALSARGRAALAVRRLRPVAAGAVRSLRGRHADDGPVARL